MVLYDIGADHLGVSLFVGWTCIAIYLSCHVSSRTSFQSRKDRDHDGPHRDHAGRSRDRHRNVCEQESAEQPSTRRDSSFISDLGSMKKEARCHSSTSGRTAWCSSMRWSCRASSPGWAGAG